MPSQTLTDMFPDRIRSWARQHASERSTAGQQGSKGRQGSILPVTNPPSISPSKAARRSNSNVNPNNALPNKEYAEPHTSNAPTSAEPSHKATATPADKEKNDLSSSDTAIATTDKPGLLKRAGRGSKRFFKHGKDALLHSWINVLLVLVPAGIAAEAAHLNPAVVFALNAIAIIPLAGLLTQATESLAVSCGDTLGALLNISLGNAVELILFIIALVKNEIRIVQAALLGSILSNLLLILGMAFLLGGLRFQEQIYNSTVTQMSACLLSLSVMSLLLPTAFHASFTDNARAQADSNTLKISRGTSVILLIVYVLYLLFQLKSHSYMYASTPQHIIDEESHPGILAEMLDSSTSSESSSDSSASDTDTSGSHTTSRRIRKAFRNRRRRKSSVSSVQPSPMPSIVSSPSQEKPDPTWESAQGSSTRRPSELRAIASGDEADNDGDRTPVSRAGQPLVRDFVQALPSDTLTDKKSRKERTRKHVKIHKKHKRSRTEDAAEAGFSASATDKQKLSSTDGTQPKLGTVDELQISVTPPEATPAPATKKGFGIRQLPSRQGLRPSLPKMLSNNVFVLPPPQRQQTILQPNRPTVRRTNSLPDRLDQPAPSTHDALPPYARANSDLQDANGKVEPEIASMSRTSAIVLLCISTALVAVCAEFLVDAIPAMIDSTAVSQAFIGLIILPIVSNAAEHVTAVTVAARNKMDLAIGVSVGSSIQIALFVTPLVVILGWIIGREMTLYFNIFETVSLFVTVFVVNFLVLDGRSNYLEGSLLIAAYVIIAVAAYFYPESANQSTIGGGA